MVPYIGLTIRLDNITVWLKGLSRNLGHFVKPTGHRHPYRLPRLQRQKASVRFVMAYLSLLSKSEQSHLDISLNSQSELGLEPWGSETWCVGTIDVALVEQGCVNVRTITCTLF